MEKILIWGTGNISKQTLDECLTLEAYHILGFIDNDNLKIGQKFYGKEIFSPSILKNMIPDKIVILTDSYDEIYNQIVSEFPELKNCIENKLFFIKQSILKRYSNNNDKEINIVLKNIIKNGLDIFNYDFRNKYIDMPISVFWDETYNLFYVWHNDKKLYFSKKYNSEQSVKEYYKFILLEQDENSPHKYLSKEFNVDEGDIVVDVGVAEGNFSLEVIDKVKKLYLIETDDDWIEALKVTFQEYFDKVTIIKAFASSYNEGNVSCLDSLISESVNFIKMDIEGNEWDALCGAKNLIANSKKLKLAICTYHGDFDQELIESFMDKNRIMHETTTGYMWFPWKVRQNYISTRLNRAIVRGYLKVSEDD